VAIDLDSPISNGAATPAPLAPVPADAALADPELAARLRLVLNRLARRLRNQTPGDLSPSLTSALVTIELRGPITLGQLAVSERVTPPSITRMVASLERLGLVRREADPGDRRVARVSLTPDGRRTVLRTRTRKTAYLAKRLHKLDESERALVRAALPVLERLLEDDR
jgi:DNA-binding MarR family transcriptional regulator